MEIVFILGMVIVAFYVILLRPVLKQQRERRRDISALEIGDRVLTAGGFFAVIRGIETTEQGPMEIALEIAPGVLIQGTPDAILRIVPHTSRESRDAEHESGAVR